MYYRKVGRPEVGDIILCTVKTILPHSVFVDIIEYKNLEGMIHISEISPGRIRNLREFVKEGKTIVCTVLNIDLQKGHIDLSLRRVNTSQRVQKLTEFKQEEKAEKFLEIVGKDLNLDLKSMYEKIGKKAIEQYGSLYLFFQNIVANKDLIRDICDDEKLGENIYNFIKDKIKRAVTDIGPKDSKMSPGVANLFALLKIFGAREDFVKLEKEYQTGKIKYVELKEVLGESIADYFKSFREKRKVDELLPFVKI